MLSEEQKKYIREFIKGFYIINLPHREDRMNNIIKEGFKINYYNVYTLIEGIRFPNLHYISGRAGCSAAHVKAITQAYERGLENFLLLEDDCYFKDERLPSIFYAIKDLNTVNWDICYFGARIKSKMIDFSNGLYRINNWGCNHCVLYNRKVMKYLIDLCPPWNADYDIWVDWLMAGNECFDVWQPKVLGQNADFYCFHSKELVAFQLPNFSDINQKEADGVNILEEDFERNKP
jgi:GR25 family glycosyltransferase involved in LPS biosynthesis